MQTKLLLVLIASTLTYGCSRDSTLKNSESVGESNGQSINRSDRDTVNDALPASNNKREDIATDADESSRPSLNQPSEESTQLEENTGSSNSGSSNSGSSNSGSSNSGSSNSGSSNSGSSNSGSSNSGNSNNNDNSAPTTEELIGDEPITIEICENPDALYDILMPRFNASVDQLRIATFNGDIKTMNQKFVEIQSWRNLCDDDISVKNFCGFSCAESLIRYHIFMSKEIQYLTNREDGNLNDSSSNGESTSRLLVDPIALDPAELNKRVQQGIDEVDHALNKLQSTVSVTELEQMPNEDQSSGNLRRLIGNLSKLYQFKVELLMTGGDIWYRSSTNARMKYLSDQIESATKVAASKVCASSLNQGEEGKQIDYLDNALCYYNEAKWIVSESLLSVPDDTSFNFARYPLQALNRELGRRLDSAEKGFLYIGVDPYGSKQIDFATIETQINADINRLDQKETLIENRLKDFLSVSSSQAQQDVDDRNNLRQNTITRDSYLITQIENKNQLLATELNDEIADAEKEEAHLLREQTLAELDYQIASRRAEVEGQIRTTQLETERTFLSLSGEDNLNQLNDLRWAIDLDIAETNANVQLKQFETEKTELEGRRDSQETELERLNNARDQNQVRINNLNLERANLEAELLKTGIQEEKIVSGEEQFILQQMCRVEAQMQRINKAEFDRLKISEEGFKQTACQLPTVTTDLVNYYKETCKLRKDINITRAVTAKQALRCLQNWDAFDGLQSIYGQYFQDINLAAEDDSACGDIGESQKDIIKSIIQDQKAMYEIEKDQLEDQLRNARAAIGSISIAQATALAGRPAKLAYLTSARAAYATISSFPQISQNFTVGTEGGLPVFTSETITESPTAVAERIARVNLEIAESAFETVIQTAQSTAEFAQMVSQLENELITYRAMLEDGEEGIGLKGLENRVQVSHLNRSLAEIFGQKLQNYAELKNIGRELNLESLECEKFNEDSTAEFNAYLAEHRGYFSQLKAKRAENELLEQDRLAINNKMSILDNEINIISLENETIALNKQFAENELRRIDSILQNIEQIMQLIIKLKGRIEAGKDNVNDKVSIRDQLVSQLQKLNTDLKDITVENLTNQLEVQSAFFDRVQTLINRSNINIDRRTSLQKQLNGLERATITETKTIRDRILKTIDDIRASSSTQEKRNIFLATQTELTSIISNLSTLTNQKRQIVERLNIYMSEYRSMAIRRLKLLGVRENFADHDFRLTANQFVTDLIDITDSTKGRTVRSKLIGFPIVKGTPLFDDLVNHRRVKLEITPYGSKLGVRNQERVLWIEDILEPNGVNGDNISVIDVELVGQTPASGQSTGCFDSAVEIRNAGWGHFLAANSFGVDDVYATFSSSAPTQSSKTLKVFQSGSNPGSAVISASNPFRQSYSWNDVNNLLITQLDNQPNPGRTYPVVGTPVLGTWELFLAPSRSIDFDADDISFEPCDYNQFRAFYLLMAVSDNPANASN